MGKRFFVAGTDTDVGKTLVSAACLHAVKHQGLSTLGLKPIAAGCEETAEGLRNQDALLLQAASSLQLDYDQVNPVALKAAIAPHIAATEEGRTLSAERLAALCRGAMMQRVDLCLVEGAGGWRVPLNARETLAELPRLLNLPVILVVGMRLGCISHALLTAEAIQRDGLRLAGWVANSVMPQMERYEENLGTLISLLPAPLIAELPYRPQANPEEFSAFFDLRQLID